jgi:uncharacterized membrane protein YtjA (UPF0391 family)
MMYWALIFLAIAVIAAIVAFGGILIAGIAKVIFYIFLVLFLIALISEFVNRLTGTPGERDHPGTAGRY